METVQLNIQDDRYAASLQAMLERNGTRKIERVEEPDLRQEGVIVVDSEGLDRLPVPLLNPERVVLITRNDPPHLALAWNAGIRSVVFNDDPLSTAVLAIMAAELRVAKPDAKWSLSHSQAPSGASCCEHGRRAKPGVRAGAESQPALGSHLKEGLK